MSSDDLGQQLNFANDLNNILTQVNIKVENINRNFNEQTQIAQGLLDSLNNAVASFNCITTASENINNLFTEYNQKLSNTSRSRQTTKYFDDFAQGMENVNQQYKQNAESAQELADSADKMTTSSQQAQKASEEAAKKERKTYGAASDILLKTNKSARSLAASAESLAGQSEKMSEELENATSKTKKFVGGLMSVLSAGKGLLKIIGSLFGMATTFIKTAMTLPLMVLDKVVAVGNGLRTDLIETIETAAQSTKEFFDAQSDIGKDIRRSTSMGKGMLLTFQRYNSSAVKLFGEGASGIANMIQETGENLKNMGVFAEVFSSAVTGPKNTFHFARIKRILGLEADELKYYAQDAAVNLLGLNERLERVVFLSEAVSKEYGVDMKRLSKNFNKLRKEISIFGHLSDEELMKTSARLTQMKLTTEAAADVFKKFNTFEDAANSVAMLSQTFGMNLDAMSIIKAENPVEIIDMFRESMMMTGRTFDELNRFEKGILADQTGMSQENLKSLMTFRDQGLTFEEAQQKLKDQKPEARQMKAMKKLNSSMKELQKVLNFDSPFQAFLKGLAKNSAASGEAKDAFMSLSNTYQMIHDFATNLDTDVVQALMDPVVLIANAMKDIFNSKGFSGGLQTFVEGLGSLLTSVFGITDSEKIHHALDKTLTGMSKSQREQFKEDIKEFNNELKPGSALKKLKEEFDKKSFKSEAARFKAFLKEARKKSQRSPEIQTEFEKLMSLFGSKYKSWKSLEGQSKTELQEATKGFSFTLSEMLDKNKGNFSKFLVLSGGTLGSIIKGVAIGFISTVNLLSHILDQTNTENSLFTSKGKGVIESFLNWEPGELNTLVESLISAFGGLFNNTSQFGFFTVWLMEQLGSVIYEISKLFMTALQAAGEAIMPGLFKGNTTFTKAISKGRLGDKNFKMSEGESIGSPSITSAGDFTGGSEKDVKSASKLFLKADANKNSLSSGLLSDLEDKLETENFGSSDYKKLLIAQGLNEVSTDTSKGPPESAAFQGINLEKTFKHQMTDPLSLKRNLLSGLKSRMTVDKGVDKGLVELINNDKYPSISDLIKKGNGENDVYKLAGKYLPTLSNIELLKNSKVAFSKEVGKNLSEKDYMLLFSSVMSGYLAYSAEQAKANITSEMADRVQGPVRLADGEIEGNIGGSTIAAKPGGVLDTIVREVGRITQDIVRAVTDTGAMSSASKIESDKEMLASNLKEAISKYKEAKKLLEEPVSINVFKDLTEDELYMIGVELHRIGLLDILGRTDIISPSTMRLEGRGLTAGNLQPARRGEISGGAYVDPP